jgi:hypothetical protein
VVAVVRGVRAGVAGAEDLVDGDGYIRRAAGAIRRFAEQDAAAFVRVGLFAVGAELVVELLGDFERHIGFVV